MNTNVGLANPDSSDLNTTVTTSSGNTTTSIDIVGSYPIEVLNDLSGYQSINSPPLNLEGTFSTGIVNLNVEVVRNSPSGIWTFPLAAQFLELV